MSNEQLVIGALLVFMGYREYQQMGMLKALLNRVMAKSYQEVATFEAEEGKKSDFRSDPLSQFEQL